MNIKINISNKFILVLCIFALNASKLNAQNFNFSIQASANTAIIPTLSQKKELPTINYPAAKLYENYTETYETKLGGKVNFNVEYSFINKFYLRTGIGFNSIRYKKISKIKMNYEIIDYNVLIISEPSNGQNPNPTPITLKNLENLGKTAISYIDVPLNVGCKLLNEKLRVSAGITSSVVIISNQNIFEMSQGVFTGEVVADKSNKAFQRFSFAANIDVTYQIIAKYFVFARYSKQLNSIYVKEQQYAGKSTYNLFEIGIDYQFR